FGADYANVQPHSGTQANLAVFFLLLKPGEKVLSLDLAAGGHLSHGMKANLSGRWFDANNYSVNPQNEVIDLDEMERIAEEIRPKLLITGGSAYPRELDFERMSKIAKKVGAHFLVDMAHIAGLVAGGVHPSPFPHADIVTCTTTKTLRGPRGGLILTNNEEWYKKLQAAVFPGVQGSLHSNVLAAKAICLGEALRDDFKLYARQVVANAKVLAETLADRGVRIVSGGTDTHIILLDLSSKGLFGKQAETLLAKANITSNKNPIPGDSPRPPEWVGMRLGSSAATTRGLNEEEFRVLGHVIADLIDAETEGRTDEIVGTARAKIAELTEKFPVYGH
ncbi:serine hydroxymethyltransferase, partial [Rhizobium phaseoli]